MDAVFWADNLTGPTLETKTGICYINNVFADFIHVTLTYKNIRRTTPNTFNAASAEVVVDYDGWCHF
jgi:hypothetical protein